MSKTTIIHCEEIAVDPVIVTLGKVQVDVAKISAYNTIRMLRMIEEVKTGDANPEEATQLILDIVQEQGKDITTDDILKEGNQHQVAAFITTVTSYVLKTYKPLQEVVGPFLIPAGAPEKNESSTSTR